MTKLPVLSGLVLSALAGSSFASDCFSLYTPKLVQEGRRDLQSSITDIGNIQKMLQCLNMGEQAETLDTAKDRINNAIRRQNSSNAGQMCSTRPPRRFDGKYPSAIKPEALFPVRSGSADGAVVVLEEERRDGKDSYITLHHEYAVASVFPRQEEIGRSGAVYVVGSDEKGNTDFYQSNGQPFIPSNRPTCVRTKVDRATADAAGADAEKSILDAIAQAKRTGQHQMVASLEKMLEQRRANMSKAKQNAGATTGGSKNCTDTPSNQTPPPYFRGNLPNRIDFVKKMGIDGNWCKRPGRVTLWIGYGSLTSADERTIKEMRNFGAQTLKALSLAKTEAERRGESAYARDIDAQMKQYTTMVAEYINTKRNADPELNAMYNNGRLGGTCWSVAYFTCPERDDGGRK